MDKIIFLEPVFFERLWGGRNLESFYQNVPAGNIGEAWVVAAHNNGSSVISNGSFKGETLAQAYAKKPQLFTQKIYNKYPLLVKILDATDDLSVQVHPDDNFASEYENGELGKTECWYVLDAKKDAKLIYGHLAETKEDFNAKINNKDWNTLLIEEKVSKGDFFYIPAGTLHAIGAGNLIYEVQQNSDTTYRVYDYDRKDKDGNLRELHIEKTKKVTTIPFEKENTSFAEETIQNSVVTTLAQEKYFGVFTVKLRGEASLTKNKTGNLFTVVEGAGEINVEGETYPLKKGDSFILTTNTTEYSLNGNMFLIGSYDR